MRKKIIGGMLALILMAATVSSGAAKVAAETEETEMMEAAEENISNIDEETVGSDTEIAESEEPSETESEDTVSGETEAVEVPAEEKVIEGMPVNLDNSLGMDIISLQVKNFFTEEYTGNLLAEDEILRVGGECCFGIPESVRDEELGMYDIQITMADGTVIEIPFVPLLDDISGSIYDEGGTVLIRIRDERLEDDGETLSESQMIRQETEATRSMVEALIDELE